MRGTSVNISCPPLPIDLKKPTQDNPSYGHYPDGGSWSDGGDTVRSRSPDYYKTIWTTGVINKGMNDCHVRGENDLGSR